MPTSKSDLNVSGDISLAEAVTKMREANGEQSSGLQLFGAKIGMAEGTLEDVRVLTQQACVPESANGGSTVGLVQTGDGGMLHNGESAREQGVQDEGDGDLKKPICQ